MFQLSPAGIDFVKTELNRYETKRSAILPCLYKVQEENGGWVSPEAVNHLADVMDIPAAQEIARICGLNLIAQARAACDGDLDRISGVVKVGGFVNAVPDFDQHPEIINGCSDLMVDVFGDKGRHSRFAVGAGSLPRGVAVEIEAIFRRD